MNQSSSDATSYSYELSDDFEDNEGEDEDGDDWTYSSNTNDKNTDDVTITSERSYEKESNAISKNASYNRQICNGEDEDDEDENEDDDDDDSFCNYYGWDNLNFFATTMDGIHSTDMIDICSQSDNHDSQWNYSEDHVDVDNSSEWEDQDVYLSAMDGVGLARQ